MNDRDRINAIQKSGSDEQLDKVMDGFREQSVAAHPALKGNEEFRRLLETGQYMRALEEIRRARIPDENQYLDVIRVLQFAVSRRLAIMMF